MAAGMCRLVTRSKYDHVAMLVRVSETKLVILESLRETGVSVCDWDRFMTKKWYDLYTTMSYRRLSCDRCEPDFTDSVHDFVKQTLGKPFKLNAHKLFRSKNEEDKDECIKPTKSFFCSELVATAYKRLGLLEEDKSASKYWPGDFAGDNIALLEGASLSKEFTLTFS